MTNWLGGCLDLAERLGLPKEVAAKACCGSCHHDEEDGYYEIGDWSLPDGTYSCCCGMREALERAGHKEGDTFRDDGATTPEGCEDPDDRGGEVPGA